MVLHTMCRVELCTASRSSRLQFASCDSRECRGAMHLDVDQTTGTTVVF